jgi:two-component system, OmpR family, response regulator QseB
VRPQRVVIVEDDRDIAALLTDILENEGYAPVAVSDPAGLDGTLDSRPDLVVLDLRLSRGGAEHILTSLRSRGMNDVPVLLLSAANDLPERARALGVTSYLAKPFELEEFLVVVRAALTGPRSRAVTRADSRPHDALASTGAPLASFPDRDRPSCARD